MKIGYRRVSTYDQSLERQELKGAERVFEEKASAGGGGDRPKLQELVEFAREGDTVLVHSIDRLARNLQDLQSIVGVLNAKGVAVEFLTERLCFRSGTENPFDRLQLQLMGAFAEFERSLIRRRQAEGIAKAKARGAYRRCGRPPAAKTLRRKEIVEMHRSGLRPATIARKLDINPSTVWRHLADERRRQERQPANPNGRGMN